jgi:hypothetical protein
MASKLRHFEHSHSLLKTQPPSCPTGYYHREQIPALAWVMRITVDEVKIQYAGEKVRRNETDGDEAVHYE